MLVTEIYKGQGLGNQLWCYVTTRVIAKDRGYDFGIQSPENFKCNDFLNLDFGKQVIGGIGPEGGPPLTLPEGITHYYKEKKITHPENNSDISIHDDNLLDIPDNTKIDGNMQDEQYIIHRKNDIREWLKVKDAYECYDFSDDDICIINFRGGEYVAIKNVFLPKEYWEDAIQHMLKINKNFRFIVITDDVKTAKEFFPKCDVFHFSIAKDYVIIKNAKYLILANTSFAWFPAWLNKNLKFCIAPKYWWAHNISDGFWACGYNITRDWFYQDRDGVLQDYGACLKELHAYAENHKQYYIPEKIKNNFLVISNYNNDISWVPERTDQYLIYDKSETNIYPYAIDQSKVVKSPNIGYNLYDYFAFIIEHYDNLPECTIFTKGNVFPRHVTKEYFDRIANNDFFTSIEDYKMHKTYWPVCFFSSDGGFCEINNSWYLNHHPTKYFHDYNDFLKFCFKVPVIPKYIRFAPGGNYIVPKENILKLPKVFYENLRTFVSHCPLSGEAHIIERALHTMWTCNFEINEKMLHLIDEKTFTPILLPLPKGRRQRSYKLIQSSINSLKQFLKKILPFSFQVALRKIVHFRVIPTKSVPLNPKTPQEERRIFDALKGRFRVVFDVGARNELSFYEMKPDCEYHLFEPNEQFVNELREQVVGLVDHRITINKFGLSDINADNCVYYEKSQSFIINPTFQQGDIDTGKRYSIRTLDRYVAEHNISHIDYLKIDAEGSDYKIILGGRDTIQNNQVSYIQFEYWDGIKKFVDVLQNYKLYLMMEPVLLKAITKTITPMMTSEEKQIDFHKSIIEVTDTLINLIDFKIIPTGNGGNVLGINKNIPNLYTDKLVFDIMNKNNTLLLLKKHLPLSIKDAMWMFINNTKIFVKKIYPMDNLRLSLSDITVYIKNIFKPKLSTEEIAEYRKTIKIYDTFYFFNELELLEIRLNILDKYVDYFVIIEATETFSGLPKKLFFEENKQRIKKFEHKIIHYVTTDTPANEDDLRKRLHDKNVSELDKEMILNALTSDNIPKGQIHWLKEFYQKESLKKALVGLSDNDFCFVSDVDEIWNPEVQIDYSKDDLIKCKQDAYYYYLNNRSNDYWVTGWTGTVATKYKNIKYNCLNHLRTHMKNNYTVIKNGGWHFTFQGGADRIRTKLQSYGHQEFNNNEIKSQLEDVLLENRDYRGRKLKFWIDETKLPKYLLENKAKYYTLFK